MNEYEIIYIDSNSTDHSIEVASSFEEVKIYQVTGPSNAAMGRNVGAKHATGRVLFFVDGDMEIYTEFLAKYWNPATKDIDKDIIAGQWLDIIPDEAPVKRPSSKVFPGGTFIVKRKVWESVGGMRTRFKTGEESDLGLRLMRKGHFLFRPDEFIINHYTVPYLHGARIWKSIWNKNIFYNRAVMYRHHFFDKRMWSLMWRADKTFILLVVALIASIIYWPAGVVLLIAYFAMVVARVATNKIYLSFFEMIGFYILSDVLNLWNFFTFFPKDLKERYERYKSKL